MGKGQRNKDKRRIITFPATGQTMTPAQLAAFMKSRGINPPHWDGMTMTQWWARTGSVTVTRQPTKRQRRSLEAQAS